MGQTDTTKKKVPTVDELIESISNLNEVYDQMIYRTKLMIAARNRLICCGIGVFVLISILMVLLFGQIPNVIVFSLPIIGFMISSILKNDLEEVDERFMSTSKSQHELMTGMMVMMIKASDELESKEKKIQDI